MQPFNVTTGTRSSHWPEITKSFPQFVFHNLKIWWLLDFWKDTQMEQIQEAGRTHLDQIWICRKFLQNSSRCHWLSTWLMRIGVCYKSTKHLYLQNISEKIFQVNEVNEERAFYWRIHLLLACRYQLRLGIDHAKQRTFNY